MRCKIIYLRKATALRFLAGAVLCLCVLQPVNAQVPDSIGPVGRGQIRTLEPGKKMAATTLTDLELHKFKAIVASINKRGSITHEQPAGNSALQGILQGNSPFAGMKDAVMGEFLHYVGGNFGHDRLNRVVKNFRASGDSSMLQQFVGNKLKGFYALKGKEAFRIPAFEHLADNQFNGAAYSLLRDNTPTNPSPWIHQWQLSNDVQLMDIPFHIEFSNVSNSYVPLRYNNLMKVSFDKEGLQQNLKQKINKYYDIEKYLLNDLDMLSYVKKHFEQELNTRVADARSTWIQDPKALLMSRFSYDELLKLDMNQVKEKLMPASTVNAVKEQIGAYQNLLLQQGKNLLPAQKDSLLHLVDQKTAHLASLEQLVAKVGEVKTKLTNSGINANQVASMQQSTNALAKRSWQQPAAIREAADNLLPQNGLQRFFRNIHTLNIGTFANSLSERTVQALVSGGLQIEALKKNNLLGGGFGQIKDAGYLKDAGLQSSLTPAVSMQYAQIGKGMTTKGATRITVLNGNSFSPNSLHYQAQNMARNMFVGTISQSFPIRKSGNVEAELSKSATQFRNTGSISPDQTMEHKSALYSYADDLLQTLSAGIRYQDDWDKIGLSHNVQVSYAGLGYNNPGNASASRGSFQYNLQLRKYVEKRKGFLQVQLANRTYNYSVDGDQKWNNLQVNIQGRYRLNRNLSLGGRLNQYQLVRKTAAGKERMYVSRKFTAEGQFTSSWLGIDQRSTASVAVQQFENVYVTGGGQSNLLLVQWATTVPLQTIQASASIFYNKELTDQQLIGDQLNGEMGLSYVLLRKITVSSSITYLDNKLAVRQIGTRQSVHTTVFGKCLVGMYVDCRKDLITPANPWLYGNFRGELTLQYLLK